MAAIAVSVLTTELIAAFPDTDAALWVTYLNKVDRKLSFNFRIRTSTISLTLTADEPNYTLSDSVCRIYSAKYVRSASATDCYPLRLRDRQWMNAKNANWQAVPSQEPSTLILDTTSTGAYNVILNPAPATATTGGYPKVTIDTAIGGTLTSGGDFPACIQDLDTYRYGAIYNYCITYRREEAPMFKQLYDLALREEYNIQAARLVDAPRGIVHRFPTGGSV